MLIGLLSAYCSPISPDVSRDYELAHHEYFTSVYYCVIALLGYLQILADMI